MLYNDLSRKEGVKTCKGTKKCFACSDFFSLSVTNQIIFCNGKKGRYIDDYENKKEVYIDFIRVEEGLNIESDGAEQAKYFFRIHCHPLLICNNSCLMCASDKLPRVLHFENLKSLIDKNIHKCKSVDIMGGEPTLWKDIFTFIEYSNSRGMSVRLFSNCRRFSDFTFARRFVDSGGGEVCVTLHSCYPDIFDLVTQRDGSFSETIQGVINLKKAGVKNIDAFYIAHNLNYKDTLQTVQFISSLQAINTISFQSLIVENSAFVNREKLLIKLSSMVPYLEEAMLFLKRSKENFIVGSFPLCLFKKNIWGHFYNGRHFRVISNNPARYPISGREKILGLTLSPKCVDCRMKKLCPGVWLGYFNFFGDSELQPL